MLVAYDKDNNSHFILSDSVDKNISYKCPVCNKNVFIKEDIFNNVTFEHLDGSNHNWEFETYEHILMKINIFNYFKDFLWISNIEYEKPVYLFDGSFLTPDILIETIRGDKIAIECQSLLYDESKINNKTRIYSKNNIYVLWIFSNKYIKKITGGYKLCNISLSNKVKCENTILKNIFYKRYFIYNDYKSDFIQCDNNIIEHINNIKEELNEVDEVRYLRMSFKRSDDDFKLKQHEYNKCFTMMRLPYKLINNGNDVIIVYDNQFRYFKNYDSLFSCDCIYFKNYNGSNDFLKLFFSKKIDFNECVLSNDNMLLCTDFKMLNEYDIMNKFKNNNYDQILELSNIFNRDYFIREW